jgi:Uma2 family endonuclease
MSARLLRHQFTVDEYYRMGAAGIISEDDRVELIEGEILEMTPISSRHAGAVNRLNRLLSQQAGECGLVSVQNPVRLGERSEPQPDLALLRPSEDCYAASHPEPKDVLLIIEVAETSADYDREVKVPLYARAGIPEVWVVDLTERRVEVYRGPGPHGYDRVHRIRSGESVSPEALPHIRLAASDILM